MNKVQEMLKTRNLNNKIDKTELIKKVRSEIEMAVSAVFETNQFVNVIAVQGHTPHFNDGDVCRWGIDVQVDWLGEAYYSKLYDEMQNRDWTGSNYAKLISERPPAWRDTEKHSNFSTLKEAQDLLSSFDKEFEAWDNEDNGTCWMFVRVPGTDQFTVEINTFDHD